MIKHYIFSFLMCSIFAVQLQAQILTESFDGSTFPPTGWTNTKISGAASPGIWQRLTSGTNPTAVPQSGAGMAYYNCFSWSSGNAAELATPALNFSSGSYSVSFWMYRDAGQPTKYDSVSVYVNTINSSSGGFRLGLINRARNLAPVVNTDGWYQYTFNIPASFNTATNYIIFKATSDFGNRLYIDDVSVFAQAQTADPISVTASSASICTGQGTTLYANGIDGTVYWYSSSCGGNLLGTGDSIFLSPTQNTTYFARNFKNNQFSSGCVSISVQVNPVYNVAVSATICADESITLPDGQVADSTGTYISTVPTTAGCDSTVTLQLTVLPEVSTSVVQTICFGETFDFNWTSYSSSGTYSVTLTAANGCDSITILNLTVLPQIETSTGISICPGDSVFYNGLYYYTAGSYVDTLTSSNGCDSISTLQISLYNTNTPGITQNTNILSTQNYVTYQWFKNGNEIPGADSQTYIVTENGSYSVLVTDVNGCTLISQAVNVIATGIDKSDTLNILLYPNPVGDRLYVSGLPKGTLYSVIIHDLLGKVVINEQITTNIVSVESLAAGTYTITLTHGHSQYRGLFQKQ